jgi:tetratricopeptide (TPR) repeat protein
MKQKKIKKYIKIPQKLNQNDTVGGGKFKVNNKYNLLLVLVIFIAGIIAYANSFDCSFHFDDKHFLDSRILERLATISDWIGLFPTRPLGILTFAANYKIHKLDLWGYHLINLMIHLINAFLVWWLTWITLSTPVMREVSISRHRTIICFLTGLLFVTHPLATQSVTYIAQRFASLATLFYLLSLILFIQGRLWRGNKNAALLFFGSSVVSAVCGILTKEIVFTLPFAVVLYDSWFIKTSPWKLEIKDKSLIVSSIMLIAFIVFFIIKFSWNIFDTVQPIQGYSYSISMKEYFLTQFRVILTYIRLFILPYNQNLDYDYSLSTSFFQIKTFFSFLILLGILLSAVLLFKKYRLISFGILWFFLTISVESSIIPISQNVIFEHRTYLPGVGFFLALTGAFYYFFREKYLKIALIILLMIAAVNTVLTYQRNKIWKTEYTLWYDCVKKSPNKARIYNNFGLALDNEGKTEEAIYYYNQAILMAPYYELAYNNRGYTYLKIDQNQLAIKDFDKAISLKEDYADAYNNRGNAYAKLGHYQNAFEDFNKAISLKEDYADAYNNRAIIYFTQDKKEIGCSDAQKACGLGNCKALGIAKSKGDCR